MQTKPGASKNLFLVLADSVKENGEQSKPAFTNRLQRSKAHDICFSHTSGLRNGAYTGLSASMLRQMTCALPERPAYHDALFDSHMSLCRFPHSLRCLRCIEEQIEKPARFAAFSNKFNGFHSLRPNLFNRWQDLTAVEIDGGCECSRRSGRCCWKPCRHFTCSNGMLFSLHDWFQY